MEWMKGMNIIFLLLLFSCINKEISSTYFNKAIHEYYTIKCKSTPCILHFNELFEFDWDKMYLFSEDYYPEIGPKEISNKIGIKYKGKREFKDQL